MTLDELEKLASAIDDFDSEASAEQCRTNDEWPSCLACGGEYRVNVGLVPTALDSGCAHDTLTDFARALLAVLPVVRAADSWRTQLRTAVSVTDLAAMHEQHVLLTQRLDTLEHCIDELRRKLGEDP